MSRIFISNLPKNIDEKTLKQHFEAIGAVTDAKIQRKQNGKSRQIGFIGFKSEDLAEKAIKHFNKTFLQSSKITVEIAKPINSSGNHIPNQTHKIDTKANISENDAIINDARIFIRNLPYLCTVDELKLLFNKFGEITEVNIPLDKLEKSKGYAFITYKYPESAINALSELDGYIYQGRVLHILPSKPKDTKIDINDERYKHHNELLKKSQSMKDVSWNSLFIRSDTILDALCDRYNIKRSDILIDNHNNRTSAAINVTLGEIELIDETKEFLSNQGINLDELERASRGEKINRSQTLLIIKNIPYKVNEYEIRKLFSTYGTVIRLILPSTKALCLVEYKLPTDADKAFKSLSYTKLHDVPIYIEYAPETLMGSKTTLEEDKPYNNNLDTDTNIEDTPSVIATLFIKNLNFTTDENGIKQHFKDINDVRTIKIARKKNSKGENYSLGFGFIEFTNKDSAIRAMEMYQGSILDDHKLEVHFSNRSTNPEDERPSKRKRTKKTPQNNSTKIIVRNLAFEATKKELRELFGVFGSIKAVRIPKKFDGTHRGFGFIEFLNKDDAKVAFNKLSQSHFYGRKLVLEWSFEDVNDVDHIRKKMKKEMDVFMAE